MTSEPEWVAADDGEPSAEPRVEREPADEPDIDVYQPGPDEPVWSPCEPVAAPESPAAEEAHPVHTKRTRRAQRAHKPRARGVGQDAAPVAHEVDAATPVEPSAEHADEHAAEFATAATKPSAAAPMTKKRKLQKFVAERAEQHARERDDERAQERAAGFAANRAANFTEDRAAARERDRAQDRAAERADDFHRERAEELARERAEEFAADRSLERGDDAPNPAPASRPVARKKRTKDADEQPVTPPIVVSPEAPIPSEVEAVAPTDAPTESASSMPSMEQYIAELATMSVAQLSKRHIEMLGKKPRIKNRAWLQRKLAWHEQTKRYGGLSVAAKRKLDELMGQIELPAPTSRAPKADGPSTRSADDLPLGTRLERKWRDRVIVATRVEGGWSCEGVSYKTLSAAAKAISGTHCSGPAWFGLWRPKGGDR